MDEEDSNPWAVRLGAVILVFLCLAVFKSWEEVRFITGGKSTQGIITEIVENRDRYGGHIGYKIYYRFRNENSQRNANGESNIADDDLGKYTVGQAVEIEYIGERIFTSRLQGTTNRFWIYACCAIILGLVSLVAWLSFQAKREEKDSHKRRRTVHK